MFGLKIEHLQPFVEWDFIFTLFTPYILLNSNSYEKLTIPTEQKQQQQQSTTTQHSLDGNDTKFYETSAKELDWLWQKIPHEIHESCKANGAWWKFISLTDQEETNDKSSVASQAQPATKVNKTGQSSCVLSCWQVHCCGYWNTLSGAHSIPPQSSMTRR